MERWLDGLWFPWGSRRHVAKGWDVRRDTIVRALRDTEGFERVKIFLGHGMTGALLGPAEGNETDLFSSDSSFSVIYDEALITPNPSALFAFCCHSGVDLGPTFSGPPGRSFLGYRAEVYVPMLDRQCRDVWRTIIRTVASEVIRDGTIDARHESRLKELYEGYLNHYIVGPGKENTEVALYMAMHLNWQSENVCRYP
ncbi:MAG TPA: hypothetical protein VF591_03080 [Pyrinomonadaceae bacterium]